ncbi:tetratricopeptide repeat protein [Halomonas vilamensis]|uniref:Tetratricopeptide repeat protein n=1 Tax=Vreelandella vilamensis TaxID=531309 RepID=A0ABU1H9X2_9GAMM|nr:tetratricopeptide repeat protein [Halomonas vilamensis]MDR5900447.1 tetratricopeptide repeat protein [Halomonas vilamensis]
MKFFIRILLCLTTMWGSSVLGQSLDEGLDAARRGDYATALENWRPLAELGFPSAQSNLGVMYQNGQGVPQNYRKAVSWYRLAAEQGDTTAQTNLGAMYENGRVVPQNHRKAVSLYRLAAEKGFAYAQNNLGVMYWGGSGVARNPVMSYMLIILAAAQGNESAQKSRDLMIEALPRDQIDEAQRMATEWRIDTPLPKHDDFTTWP